MEPLAFHFPLYTEQLYCHLDQKKDLLIVMSTSYQQCIALSVSSSTENTTDMHVYLLLNWYRSCSTLFMLQGRGCAADPDQWESVLLKKPKWNMIWSRVQSDAGWCCSVVNYSVIMDTLVTNAINFYDASCGLWVSNSFGKEKRRISQLIREVTHKWCNY